MRSFSVGSDDRPYLWWAPDSKRVLFRPRGHGKPRTIVELDVETGETTQLFAHIEGAERFRLTPDGKTMLFYRWNDTRNNGRRELVVAELGQREGRVLAAEPEEEIGPFSNWVRPLFSPDGGRVLFATMRGDLWLAAADGSERRILATAEEIELEGVKGRLIRGAGWHPDGSCVFYDNWQALFVVDLATGEQRKYTLPENLMHSVEIWQWSPDGKQIAITGQRGGGPELWLTTDPSEPVESK